MDFARYSNPISVAAPIPMIRTKFIGPTDYKGSRVSATHITTGSRSTLEWDDALDTLDNHARAAETLAKKLNLYYKRFYHTAERGGAYIWALTP